MKQKKTGLSIFKTFLFTLFLAIELLPFFALAQTTGAVQSTDERCKNFQTLFAVNKSLNIIGGSKVYCSATELILAVISYALAISGTITILFLMIGGFLYITSAGNEEQSEKGRKILTNSVIGLVVIILSYSIVRIISATLSLGK
jgi:hypothetical protein